MSAKTKRKTNPSDIVPPPAADSIWVELSKAWVDPNKESPDDLLKSALSISSPLTLLWLSPKMDLLTFHHALKCAMDIERMFQANHGMWATITDRPYDALSLIHTIWLVRTTIIIIWLATIILYYSVKGQCWIYIAYFLKLNTAQTSNVSADDTRRWVTFFLCRLHNA